MDLLLKFLVLLLFPLVPAIDFVYIRSGSFGQHVTSNTLRWTKASPKDPIAVPNRNLNICHLSSGPRSIGLEEDGQCRVETHDGQEEVSSSYQLLSGHASKVVWTPWQRPNSPPTGSVALSETRFIAYSPTTGSVGYVDSKSNLGTCVFPTGPETKCVILTEIEPMGYELSEIELKKPKEFVESPVILATATLSYIPPDDSNEEDIQLQSGQGRGKTRAEKVLTYQLNQFDYWGQGHLMAKGLHTVIKFPPGTQPNQKIIEWGISFIQSSKTETVPVYADLDYGTGLNVTIQGIHRKGEMTYWALLKTFYKDGSTAKRHIQGQRKVDQVEDIRVKKGPLFYVNDGSLVTTTTTTVTQITTTETVNVPVEQPELTSSQVQQSTEHDELESERSSNLMLNSAALKLSWSNDKSCLIGFTICTFIFQILRTL